MGTPTYKALATVTLGTSAASVTFSSIPATYRDLVMVLNCKVVSGDRFPRGVLNADTGSNYQRVALQSDGLSVFSNTGTDAFLTLGNANTTFAYNSVTHFMDYSATDKHKTVICRSGVTGLQIRAITNRWANTDAITSIKVELDGSSYDTGSTFSLYGIAS
jgi:hypothetical protein